MAYVSKEKKAKIVAAVKAVLPKGWKATFAVRHHSSIVCTITEAPKSVECDYIAREGFTLGAVNTFHPQYSFEGKTLDTVKKIIAALNTDNFDKSDSMSDFFHVGHYIDLNFGKWDKPCRFV